MPRVRAEKKLWRSGLVVAVSLALAPAVQAEPTPWLLIASHGDAPNRSAHYLAIDIMVTSTDLSTYDPREAARGGKGLQYLQDRQYTNVWVVQVLENAKEPDSIFYSLNVRCRQKEVQFQRATAVYRNDTEETVNSDAWMPIPDNWLGRVYTAACDFDNVASAIKTAQDNKSFDNLEKMKPLTDLGMVYVGKFEAVDYGTALPNFTWKNLWKSGTRPKYTTSKTPEQIRQEQAKLDAGLAQLGDKAKEWEGTVANLDAEREFITAVNKTFKTKNSSQQKLFFNMEGWTEEEIAGFWGVPSSANDLGGTRALEYYTENDTRQTRVYEVPVVDSSGKQIGSQQMQTEGIEQARKTWVYSIKSGEV